MAVEASESFVARHSNLPSRPLLGFTFTAPDVFALRVEDSLFGGITPPVSWAVIKG
jgi:hypothetical protein